MLWCIIFLFAIPTVTQAEIKSRIKPGWNKSDETNLTRLTHYPWTNFLKKYVTTDGELQKNTLNYQAVTNEDKKHLTDYIKSLSIIDPRTLNKREQFAYWVNLYNSLTVKLIIDHYPVESIKDIKAHGFSFGPWDKNVITIAGEPFSLNDIQHKILRPIWKDSLVHYALSCAALSCPQVRKMAYNSRNSDWMLQTSARRYVNNNADVYFAEDGLHLSAMYQWYGDDFSRDQNNGKGFMSHIIYFAEEPLRQRLRDYRGLVHFDFDWSLNKAQTKNQTAGE